jgi:curli biogenesis system outer membrane secretion channel CsgG
MFNHRVNIAAIVSLLILLLVTSSCASRVIKRSQSGRVDREAPRQHFSAIRKKVALLTFFNESPYGGDDLGVVASEELRMELGKTGEFIIDPLTKKIFGSSKEVYAGGGVKLAQLARKAKVAGVNFVILGRVIEARIREKTDEIGLVRQTKSYTESRVEVRMFDVNSGRELLIETLRGYADDSSFRFFSSDRIDKAKYRQDILRYSVKVALRKSIPKILEISSKMDWIGRVAKIIGTKIYVNAGRASGINIGDILKVITEGNEIFDPETGALIGVSKGEIKGTIEIVDYFGQDGAVAILHSGGSVIEGDFVQLY